MTAELAAILAEIEAENAIWAALAAEFPTWEAGDLRDAAGSTSPRMSAGARAVQVRYRALCALQG